MDSTLSKLLSALKKNGQYAPMAIGWIMILISSNVVLSEGWFQYFSYLVKTVRKLPLVEPLVQLVLKSEVKGALNMLAGSSNGSSNHEKSSDLLEIPQNGIPKEELLLLLNRIAAGEKTAESGGAFAYTYTSNACMKDLSESFAAAYEKFRESSELAEQSHEDLLFEAWKMFSHSNALNPMMYPSLRQFENEIVSMTAWMLHGDGNCAGSVTSGGSESIEMCVLAYRERARKLCPHIKTPNIIASITVHPAFEKAVHYFGISIIHVPTRSDYRMDIDAVRKAINKDTILLVGSAPQYCHGVIDPIEELASLAQEFGLPCHVDACFGGFMLPWLEKLGISLPLWDFRVNGVTSISADLHKYGYASKGASIVVYRDESYRNYQYFSYSQWPGGLFGSPSMAGSRPGGLLAQAWAAMVSMGQSGYCHHAQAIYQAVKDFQAGIKDIAPLQVLSNPEMTAVALVSQDPSISIYAIADIMEEDAIKNPNTPTSLSRCWRMERQQLPPSLHFSFLPQHVHQVDALLRDLKLAVELLRREPARNSQGSTGIYGMVATIPDQSVIEDFVIKFFSGLFTFTDKNSSLLKKYQK